MIKIERIQAEQFQGDLKLKIRGQYEDIPFTNRRNRSISETEAFKCWILHQHTGGVVLLVDLLDGRFEQRTNQRPLFT